MAKLGDYRFCVAAVTVHSGRSGESLKDFLHNNNGHAPPDVVFETSPGEYVVIAQGHNLPAPNLRRVDLLLEEFIMSEAARAIRDSSPFDVSVGIEAYEGNDDLLLSAYAAQRRFTLSYGPELSCREQKVPSRLEKVLETAA